MIDVVRISRNHRRLTACWASRQPRKRVICMEYHLGRRRGLVPLHLYVLMGVFPKTVEYLSSCIY